MSSLIPRLLAVGLLLGFGSLARAQTAPDAGTAPPPDAAPEDDAGGDVAPEDGVSSDPEAPAGEPDDTPDDAPADPAPARVEPPRVLRSPAPVYPEAARGSGEHPNVVLLVTLDDHGAVQAVEVVEPTGSPFDEAARETVRTWGFAPALRDGRPVAARVQVAVHFELPAEAHEHAEPDPPAAGPREPGSSAPEADPREPDPPQDVDAPEPAFGAEAEAEADAVRREGRSASAFEVERDVLQATRRREGADLLQSAPGFYVARPAGAAIAHRIIVRGFDADHGQDVAIEVGGLPINLPSHVHGQGYADLGFLIPEVVDRMQVIEGVHDPRQGDFAVAGSVGFDLGVEERGFHLQSSYGSFGTFRQLATWAPVGGERGTFGAFQVNRSDGFGSNRRSLGASAIVQVAGDRRHRGWRFRTLGFVNVARADLAGVVRRDDIDASAVDFYGVYPFATAQNQNASNGRLMVGVFGERRLANGANADLAVFGGLDLFRTQMNFTGFIEESRVLEDVAGRGDLIEQRNRTGTLGLRGSYRSPVARPFGWLAARIELGTQARVDWITQQQNLIDATVRNQTWDNRVDADIFGVDVGFYGDLALELGERVDLSVGARADVLLYEVDDRLGNFLEVSRSDTAYIVGYRRSSMGVAAGPRASLVVEATDWLTFLSSYGEGFRSPQARVLDDGERAPFTKVRSADLGARLDLDGRLVVTVAGFWTRLSYDVAFEPAEGTLERISATRRLGAVANVVARPLPWLVAAGSLTYVDAELLEKPPATVEEPDPPFEEGQNLPYVPPVVVRLDLAADGKLTEVRGRDLRGHAGVGFSYLSPRPLPYGAFADPVSLLDASASLAWGPVEVGLDIYNLLDSLYAAFELNYVSDWSNGGVPSRIPARHIQAGAPRTVMGRVGLTW